MWHSLARNALAPLLVELPRDVQLDEEGALQDFQRDANEILGALWLSILLVFVVMAIMFENVVLMLVLVPFGKMHPKT